MKSSDIDAARKDHVLFAHEGFVDAQMLEAVEDGDVRIIEVRVLADGLMLHTVTSRHLPA